MLWLIVGLIVGVGAAWLVLRVRTQKISVMWYEWGLALLAVIAALLAVQNFDASLAELEPRAAWFLLGLFGIPALVLGALTWFSVGRHNRAA